LGSDKELVITQAKAKNRVNADPTHVEQVLINLIANARDATTPGGRVTISVEDVFVRGGRPVSGQKLSMVPGHYVLLTVSDTGAGIDPETISRIFEPFFTTKPVGQGTGLGLSMVYGIVKQHGGYIWAHSQPGRGTDLRLYWPAISLPLAGEARDHDDETERRSLPKGARVLVVEDEEGVRQLAIRTLQSAGLTVTAAKDGSEALRLLREASPPPDMLLTDVVMPHLSGGELSATAASLYPGIPVLFISGYAGNEVFMRRLIPEGAVFLQKPFTPGDLIRATTELLVPR